MGCQARLQHYRHNDIKGYHGAAGCCKPRLPLPGQSSWRRWLFQVVSKARSLLAANIQSLAPTKLMSGPVHAGSLFGIHSWLTVLDCNEAMMKRQAFGACS